MVFWIADISDQGIFGDSTKANIDISGIWKKTEYNTLFIDRSK